MGSQTPVGMNDLSYALFQNGDIILVHDGLCANGYMVNYMNNDEVARAQETMNIMGYLRQQMGEPFIITSSKDNETQWYCVKLPWKGWNKYTGIDIDYNMGYMVAPDDISLDLEVSWFAEGY